MLEKTYTPKALEEKFYHLWENAGAFQCDPTSSKTPFTLMMPPPNVTGTLHIGHALTYTLQDILVRYNRMLGRDTLWQPGTDHAGIATQMVVERQLAAEGLDRRTMGREAFLERVWSWKNESGGAISKQLRLLGSSADWSRERFTMDEGLSAAVRKVFVELFRQGLIYKDKRLVNWDPKLHTAISDLEVEQRDTKGHLWYIRYPLQDNPSQFITVATTRPETLFGDTAVAVHPEDPRYQTLIGKSVKIPLTNRTIKIIADDYCDAEKGSGAVKITPGHDFNDFAVGKRHGLEVMNILTQDAILNENVPQEFQGLDRFVARKKVIAMLEEQELLEKIEGISHTVPHGDRSGVVIEPWLTDQWYVDAKTLAAPALKAVEEGETVFVPQNWTNTYYEWLRNIEPWCISRQIWWGHRVPAWYGPDGTVFVAETEEDAISQATAHYGQKTGLAQDEDVLDTWFSSALWPFSTLGWPNQTQELERYYSTDVLVTGFDIIFFWVARMMMMGMHFTKEVPFKTVYIHSLVRDEKGQKMSKSKGNVMDPVVLIDKFGTDALRFTLCALSAQGRDIKLSEARIEGYRNFTTKIWNAARFLEMNGVTFDADFDPSTVTGNIARWLVHEMCVLQDDVNSAFTAYKFNELANTLYHGFWNTYCDWGLELSKCVLQSATPTEDPEILKKTLGWAFVQFLRLMHPVIPYVTEALWEHFQGESSQKTLLITGAWPTLPQSLKNPHIKADIDWVVQIISEIRSSRAEVNLSPKEKIILHVQESEEASLKLLDKYQIFLTVMGGIKEIRRSSLLSNTPALKIIAGGLSLSAPVGDLLDIDSEKARLVKDLSKLTQDIVDLQKRLENPDFVARAPQDIIEELQTRLVTFKGQKERLARALGGLEIAA